MHKQHRRHCRSPALGRGWPRRVTSRVRIRHPTEARIPSPTLHSRPRETCEYFQLSPFAARDVMGGYMGQYAQDALTALPLSSNVLSHLQTALSTRVVPCRTRIENQTFRLFVCASNSGGNNAREGRKEKKKALPPRPVDRSHAPLIDTQGVKCIIILTLLPSRIQAPRNWARLLISIRKLHPARLAHSWISPGFRTRILPVDLACPRQAGISLRHCLTQPGISESWTQLRRSYPCSDGCDRLHYTWLFFPERRR